MLKRVYTTERLNEIVNDLSIYPWIKGNYTKPIDLTDFAANPDNVCLLGEHGCVLFQKLQPGIYEFHTNVLPEGRGKWMLDGAKYAFRWLFTKTDAFELLTKCPDGNIASKAGARAVGCSLVFRTGPIWPTDNGMVPVDVYSIIMQNWVKTCPELAETGKLFHELLHKQYAKLGKIEDQHPEDETHNIYVGAAAEMILNGQAVKAMYFYNRFAKLSGYQPIILKSLEPLIIDIKEAVLRVRDGEFEVIG